jgi:hypothetical protein
VTAPVTVETLVRALARFSAAEHFRSRTPISDELAAIVGYNASAVSPAEVNALLGRGWLAHPAGGQYCTTETGRAILTDAVNARREAKPNHFLGESDQRIARNRARKARRDARGAKP